MIVAEENWFHNLSLIYLIAERKVYENEENYSYVIGNDFDGEYNGRL